ncbi:TauD/TfdA family dioxygenase [Microbulbifer sp. YPW1]|uniref:TauD/TfdA family dioxygenase n=1 Tax=Microbulbifer sp. YPW1 TaxID=2745199 RepID=UPI00159862D1|nr:TauD/TfdA family dioxygenase [Microbulbifer sp. YPW1]QKX16905.1 TauD/TfdA family dioxygenase [Microbulbifer sp. YPW1]
MRVVPPIRKGSFFRQGSGINMSGERETDPIRQRLKSDGYALLKNRAVKEALNICSKLGKTIRHDDVWVDPNSRAHINSDCLLDFHTDHSRAKYIAWYCLKQSSCGGESMLLDSYKVLDHLREYEIKSLRKIYLYQHFVFEGDARSWPLLSDVDGAPQIYYASWLIDSVDQRKREIRKLNRLLNLAEKIKIRLTPGDFLVIDNRRILHGRGEIKGTKDRHLRRFWLA